MSTFEHKGHVVVVAPALAENLRHKYFQFSIDGTWSHLLFVNEELARGQAIQRINARHLIEAVKQLPPEAA